MHWTEKFFIKKAWLWLEVMNTYFDAGKKEAKNIIKMLKENGMKKGKILEIGCGNGRICIPLAKRGFEVTGIDISPLYIEDARKRAKRFKANINFLVGDMRRIDEIFKKRKFDVVLNVWTGIGYYDKKTDKRIFKKVYNILKNKGLFLILRCMSKEMCLYNFRPAYFTETDRLLVLNKSEYDFLRSRCKQNWIFYEKQDKNLKYIDEFEINLRIYSHQEIIEMAENAGFKFLKAYKSIYSLEPPIKFSAINFVFQK